MTALKDVKPSGAVFLDCGSGEELHAALGLDLSTCNQIVEHLRVGAACGVGKLGPPEGCAAGASVRASGGRLAPALLTARALIWDEQRQLGLTQRSKAAAGGTWPLPCSHPSLTPFLGLPADASFCRRRARRTPGPTPRPEPSPQLLLLLLRRRRRRWP